MAYGAQICRVDSGWEDCVAVCQLSSGLEREDQLVVKY